jgi:serine/threonine-protein kinase
MEQDGTNIYEFDGFRLDPQKRLLSRDDGTVIPLMPKAFDTLLYLVENSGRVVDKDEMFREVWPDTIVEENNLTQNISILRKVFGEKPGQHRFIVTVPGRGYRFVADVRQHRGLDPPPTVETPIAVNEVEQEAHTNRYWFMTLGLITLISLVSLGFYFLSDSPARGDKIRSIAVLPFKPLTTDNRNESMEFGMADSLISRLSDGDDLIVRPLFSVRRFTSPDEDPVAAGRSLAVEAVLDGSIQLAPDKVRVSARLFRVSDGKQIWSEQFDEDRTNIFEVQDSIADRVARALNTRLSGKANSHPGNLDAYENYMLGRVHVIRLVMPEVKKGIAYYERAIAADPNYALAYVGIAEAQRALVMSNDLDPQLAFVQAKSAASRAVELDPNRGESHLALGMIAFIYDWDWPLAEEHLRG